MESFQWSLPPGLSLIPPSTTLLFLKSLEPPWPPGFSTAALVTFQEFYTWYAITWNTLFQIFEFLIKFHLLHDAFPIHPIKKPQLPASKTTLSFSLTCDHLKTPWFIVGRFFISVSHLVCFSLLYPHYSAMPVTNTCGESGLLIG